MAPETERSKTRVARKVYRYRDAELVRLEFGLLGPPPPPSPPPELVGGATGGPVKVGVNDENDMTIKRLENRESKDQL